MLILLLFAVVAHNESTLYRKSVNNMEEVYHPLLHKLKRISTALQTAKVNFEVFHRRDIPLIANNASMIDNLAGQIARIAKLPIHSASPAAARLYKKSQNAVSSWNQFETQWKAGYVAKDQEHQVSAETVCGLIEETQTQLQTMASNAANTEVAQLLYEADSVAQSLNDDLASFVRIEPISIEREIESVSYVIELLSEVGNNPTLVTLDEKINALDQETLASLMETIAHDANGTDHTEDAAGNHEKQKANAPKSAHGNHEQHEQNTDKHVQGVHAIEKFPIAHEQKTAHVDHEPKNQHNSHRLQPEPMLGAALHTAGSDEHATDRHTKYAIAKSASLGQIAKNAIEKTKAFQMAMEDIASATSFRSEEFHDVTALASSVIIELEDQITLLEARLSYILDTDNHVLMARLDKYSQSRYLITILGCALALLVSLLMSKQMSRQVKLVTDGTGLLAEGQLDHRIPVTANDQLGQISSAFNKMADKLRLRDSERNSFMEEIDRSAREAESANAAKSDFMASMSHEIRTPINGVLGTAELLLREPLTRSQLHLAETIERSGSTLLQIINDILDFSKIESGNMELDNHPFNLRELIEDIGEMAAPSAHAKGLQINYLLDVGLNEHFVGDALRIRQILMNLVSNAIKFTSEGDVDIVATSKTDNDSQSKICITLTDPGIGMTEETLERIFQPFSQASRSTARQYGGTGLGLSISRQLTEMMNGELSVESELGKGSRFTLEIQLAKATEYAEHPSLSVGQSNKHILLLTNHTPTKNAITSQLKLLDIESAAKSSGQSAFQFIEQQQKEHNPIDLLIVDSHLADMSGVDFLRELKTRQNAAKSSRKIKLCMVNEPEYLTRQYLDVDIEYTLNKPVRQSALFDCLTNITGGQQQLHHSNLASVTDEQFCADVLLVEDHPVNQNIIETMLKKYGCTVTLAENGEQALELLKDKRFDITFMDCDMPVLDGFEATRKQRLLESEQNQSNPQFIVALTANALNGDRERCLDAGMDDYLTKPLRMINLKNILTKWHKSLNLEHADTDTELHQGNVAQEANLPLANESISELLDVDTVEHLISMDDSGSFDFFDELLGSFESNWHKDIRELNQSLSNEEFEVIRKTAHKLKSASATMGAVKLSASLSEIESNATEGNLNQSIANANDLPAMFEATLLEYGRYIDRAK